MTEVEPKDVNPDDYLGTDLGYDMPVDADKEASSVEGAKSAETGREKHTYSPDDFSQGGAGIRVRGG